MFFILLYNFYSNDCTTYKTKYNINGFCCKSIFRVFHKFFGIEQSLQEKYIEFSAFVQLRRKVGIHYNIGYKSIIFGN